MKQIQLSHGGGGEETNSLIHDLFYRYFSNDILIAAEDAAVLEVEGKIAFTTDSFTVSPIFFSGGDIGKLAIAGTVNDLAMMGAKPLYLSTAFMIEEGFAFDDLETIVKSMAKELEHSAAKIVCGDTKVVPKGAVDKIFINTSGIGEIQKEGISANNLQEGDVIIVSGDVGRHGAAILMEREGLGITGNLESDCATLWPAVDALIESNVNISALRDATRGGLSAVLNEWAEQSAVCIEIEEKSVPVDEAVQGICELFGFEAFDFANEGTCILALPAKDAPLAIETLQKLETTKKATVIGAVSMKKEGKVILHSPYGSSRYLDLPKGELLPRIC
ncbi:MAG: [NiFe] hydrogenase metallocenter assembly protein HypE [uncultured Sulfurovum sp.]|uniref:[NiFe] hydrogenase metallocenter assembly protein HypE n=1 Tax=uncultured Sulfurovum sp. TaxID=269237 RepID=A0A6S6S6I1_9BACT|nr:MAG: [NiFe] hydrogenase metallocenter assembly protein HypE [uncultured Sulfurovum sp.]